jgi:hypothetical protein
MSRIISGLCGLKSTLSPSVKFNPIGQGIWLVDVLEGYPYFDVVVGLLCGHMIPRAMLAVAYATGRASHAREVKGDDPDKKGYPGPPVVGFGVGLTTPHNKKLIVKEFEKRKKLDGFNDDGESW